MVLGKLFGKLAGGSPAPAKTGTPVEHEGFTITPAPRVEANQFYVAGTISKSVGGELREHQFIRADTHGDFDTACDHSVRKARQIIKEQGERIFKD